MAKTKRRRQRLLLPTGCSSSSPAVHPTNWKQVNASCQADWYITYRFYDPQHSPAGALKMLKGMNHYRSAPERRAATEQLLEDLVGDLKQGWNPVTGNWMPVEDYKILDPYTPLPRALQLATQLLTCVESTKRDIRGMMHWIPMAIAELELKNLPVGEVRKKHIKLILQRCSTYRSRVDPETGKTITCGWSSHKHNKWRSYLMILFSEIVEAEAIEANPLADLRKQKKTRRVRKTLTERQRTDISLRLAWWNYPFWRFMQVFFHSGARESELMQIRARDVDLENQKYKRLVKKDRDYKEELTTIKDIALPLWEEALEGCAPDDFVFSRGFLPAAVSMRSDRIARVWKKQVKDVFGIEADFYSMKHSNTDEIDATLGSQAAAKLNAQTSDAMVISIYATGRADREHERLKKADNSFA